MMRVTIKQSEYADSFVWQPQKGRAYPIQLNQIVPSRYHAMITANCRNGGFVVFNYFYYDQVNKLLLVSNEKIV